MPVTLDFIPFSAATAIWGQTIDILELLIANPNKVFTRANLFESVWKDDFMGDDNTVNVHISNLRAKLSKVDKDNEYIFVSDMNIINQNC